MRRLVALAVFLAAASLSASSAEARSGAVFIHGAGTNYLNDPAGARAYWTEDMLRASTRNWAVPHLVVRYDGTKLMWIGADQAAAQIYDWMLANQVDDIVVNTHSFGGTVIRWIMSNPTWNTRYPAITARIRWVNTLAAPHKGSEAANLAGTLGGSWLTGWLVNLVGTNTDAHKNCRTDWMAYYNQNYLYGTSGRPALPRSLYTVAGTGLWNDLSHGEDYGLATLSGVAGMPGEDDGMVSQYSAQGAGFVWFTTDANHHHNRRHDYRRLGDNLGSDFALTLAGGGKGGAPAEGTDSYGGGQLAAPAQVSRTFVRTVALSGGRASVDLPVADGELVVWTLAATEPGVGAAGSPVQAVLHAPSGQALADGVQAGAVADSLPELGLRGEQGTLRVDGVRAGTYRLELSGSGARTAVTVVAAQPASALKLSTWSGPLSRQPGEPVTVYAALTDGEAALAGASVSARFAAPSGLAGAPVHLFDDGRHGDGAAGDGVYAARVDRLGNEAGLWTVRVEARGADARGQEFARTGGSGFITEAGAARLQPGVTARVVDGKNGRVLRVQAVADVARAGRFRFDATAAGAAGADGARAALGHAENTQALAAGRTRLSMDVPLVGDPALVDVRLLGMDTPGLAGRVVVEIP
jgi:hypothetical protein